MDEPAVGRSIDATGRSERLESWKEIAAHLGRGVTTVQRWEQHEGLPVHRLPHARGGSVFALKSELDAWRETRAQWGPILPNGKTEALLADRAESSARWRVPFVILVFVTVAVAALGVTWAFRQTNAGALTPAEKSVAPRPLANDAAEEQCPSQSPDGRNVVYHWGRDVDPGLYIKPLAGGQAHRLASGDAGDLFQCGYAKWSPRGDLIAYLARGDAGTKNIYVVSSAGGQPRRVTSASGIGLCWAPDGQSLAFVDRNSSGEPFSVFQIDLRGGERTRLTTPPLGSFGDTHCAFSPDGRKLAVIRYASRHQSDLYVVAVDDTDGEGLERLTTGSVGMDGMDWSPDGQLIVFGSMQGLWKVPATGSRQRATRVAAFDGGARFPTFSRATADRSANSLVYESAIVDVNIWRWDIAERQAKKLVASTAWEDFPAIAPRGDHLAFASNRTGENEVWTVNADGSDPREVTFHRGPVVTSPQWSPDGTRIAFSSQVGDNRDIYVIRSDGSQSNRITTGPSEERSPSWSHDGRSLYFRSDQSGIGQIWKVPVSGGTPIRVTTGEASQAFESRDGSLLYFVRSTNVPGVWSVPVDGGRERLVVPDVLEGYWSVADTGIYFLTPTTGVSPVAIALKFFDFASGRVSSIASPPGQWDKVMTGFSVSRDGKFVFWTQQDNAIKDLMLIAPWKP